MKMGAGIAVQFNRLFNMKNELKKRNDRLTVGTMVTYPIAPVFNLVTKENYWDKPTYETLKMSLEELKAYLLWYPIKKVAMPKIGCGLDGLDWDKVREIIKDVFNNVDCEIIIRYL